MFSQHKLAWGLAGLHGAWCALIFGIAASNPASDLLPIYVILTDLPASLLASWLAISIAESFPLNANYFIWHGAFNLVVGSLWFYLVGRVLEWWMRSKRTRERGPLPPA